MGFSLSLLRPETVREFRLTSYSTAEEIQQVINELEIDSQRLSQIANRMKSLSQDYAKLVKPFSPGLQNRVHNLQVPRQNNLLDEPRWSLIDNLKQFFLGGVNYIKLLSSFTTHSEMDYVNTYKFLCLEAEFEKNLNWPHFLGLAFKKEAEAVLLKDCLSRGPPRSFSAPSKL